jgi:acyltransferase protein
MIGIAAALIALGSLAACLSSSDRNFAFYFPLTRFWELGAGILLSYSETFIGFSTSHFSQNVRNGLSIAGILMIVLPMAFVTESAAHPGLITLIPVLGAVLIIAAEPDAFFNRTLLCWRPMTFVGLISYSLYLWHWPLLAYLFIAVPDATPSVLIAALALSFVIAALVYFYVENPIRRCRNSGKAVLLLLAGLVLMLALGETIRQTDGFPQRPLKFEDKVISVRAENEWDGFEKAPRFKYEGVDIATPNPNAFPSLIFIGDSHMAQYYLRAQRLSEREHVNFGMIAKAGWFLFNDQRMGDYARAVKAIVADKRVHTLVIGSMWGGKIKEEEFYQVAATVRPLLETRKDLKVYVMLDYPWTPNVGGQQGIYDPLKHVNRITGDAVGMVQPFPAADDWKRGNEEIQRILGDAAEYIDPTPIVCPGQKCNLQAWYRDDDHLQPKRIEADGIWVDRIFEHAAAAESKERSR